MNSIIRLLLLGLLGSMLSPAADAARRAAPPPPVVVAPSPPDPEAWRATAPAPGPEPTWKVPAVRTFTLQNGVPVYFVANEGLPLVSVRLVLKVGREANPADQAGLGALTVAAMREGTRSRTGAELAAEAAMLGATLDMGAGLEGVVVALDALAGKALGPALDLMADQVRNPRFDKADFARVQANTIAGIEAAAADPRDLAGRATLYALFGADHPYGRSSTGTRESVGSIRRSDVKKFYKSWWGPQNLAVVVTGSVDEATLRTLLDERLGDWKPGKSIGGGAVPAPAVPLKPRVVFVEVPGAVQSVVRVVTPAMNRSHADFSAAYVEGMLVGGMFSSRINMNLREEQGWSYGAYGGFSESRDHGAFMVRTSVQADKTAPAVLEILKELKAAADTAPTEAGLGLAKDNILKALPGDFESNAGIAGVVSSIPTFGLPADHLVTWPASVSAVDSAAAAAAARRYFGADRLIIVVAGPRELTVGAASVGVAAELKALGFEYSELATEQLR